MFRDLKEYQEIAKIYAEKVSKPEDLDERVRGGGVSTGGETKKFTPTPQKGMGGGTGNPTNRRGSGAKPRKPERKMSNIPVIDGPVNNPEYGKNMSRSKEDLNLPKDTEAKPKSKFIKREKGKVGFVKRGTVGARRAENIEKNRMRAQAMAKARIEAKKKAAEMANEEITPYDMVREYLLSTEQVATIEEANYVMMQLDEENIQEIVKAGLGAMKAIGKFGAKSPLHFAGTLATTAAVAPTVGKLAYKATETAGNVVNKIANFDPIGDARKKNIEAKQKKYREKSGTTKDDGYFYDPTIDKKG